VIDLHALDGVAGGGQRLFDSRQELVHRFGGQAEEVEIAGPSSDISTSDQRRSAGKREPGRLIEAGDDLGDLSLNRSEHLRVATVGPQPTGPRVSDGGWEDELFPEVQKLVCVDVVPNVILGAFSQDLLVDSCTIGSIVEVVDHRCAAPPDVERQRDPPSRLRMSGHIEIGRDGHRSGCGSKRGASCGRHPDQCMPQFWCVRTDGRPASAIHRSS
jgi:hypothetical protein